MSHNRSPLTLTRKIAGLAIMLACLVGLRVTSTHAQTSSASITSINVVSTSTTNATVSFSYSSSLGSNGLWYQLSYGPTVAYGVDTPKTTAPTGSGNAPITMDTLNPSTTYHFVIRLFDVATNTLLTSSADRTFTTASTNGGGGILTIQQIRTDCVSAYCTIYFSTSKSATVAIGWDSTSHATGVFANYPAGPSETTPSSALRSLRVNGLNANTKYYYRLQATAAGPSTFTTSELTVLTSSTLVDHVFATGSCSSGGVTVDIGSCLGNQLCSASGVLVNDCVQCGTVCPSTQSCRTGVLAGSCVDDPKLTNSPSQCNNASCYDAKGALVNPLPGACYASWPRCNANTILKVRKDRGCNLWLSCATSIQTDSSATAPSENLCLSLGACNSLNTKGQCNHYLPLGQCSNDALRFCNTDTDCQNGGTCNNPDPSAPTRALQTLTYATPADVTKIADLSGNVVAGLDWGQQGGANVIQGMFPWQLMRQVGGDAQIKNGDFEYRAPETDPWITVPEGDTPPEAITVEFEDKDNSPNHVLVVDPITQVQVQRCSNALATSCTVATVATDCPTVVPAATCVEQGVDAPYSGAASNLFSASPSEYYYAEARVRADGGNPVVRMQFGYAGYSTFQVTDSVNGASVTTNTYVDVSATAAWQRVTIGPIRGMSGATRLAFVCADKASCAKFEVDDVVVKPVLQVNTDPQYLTPSCRLFPKSDSPSCDYADTNGVLYKGWKGYCLEHDSQTGTCLSWWPVDIIRGESSIFGSEQSAGYQDRTPLYICAESSGGHGNQSMATSITHFCGSGDGCGGIIKTCQIPPAGSNICINFDNGRVAGTANATGTDTLVNRNNIYAYAVTFTNSYNDFPLPSGPVYATEDNGWNAVNSPDGGFNYFTVHLNWNADGSLRSFDWDFSESRAGSDARGFSAVGSFVTKEMCSKFVQVVDTTGEASTFASRVGSSVYKVPDLGYGLSTDLAPFGAIYQPANAEPTTWPILGAEQPDYINFSQPGQVRSGAPYACNGKCDDVICTIGGTTCLGAGGTVDSSKVRACQQQDINNDAVGDGECIGVTTNAAINKGLQTFNPGECVGGTCTNGGAACTSSIQCQTTLNTVGNNAFFAQERIKRLFTQTYGVWTDLRCSTSGAVCVQNSTCGAGTCSVHSGKYALVPNSLPTFTTNITGNQAGPSNQQTNFIGWNPPTEICPANPGYKADACTSATQQCTGTVQVTGNSTTVAAPKDPETPAMKQEAMAAALAKCGLSSTSPIPTSVNTPINGIRIGAGVVACVGDSPTCPGNADYQKGTNVAYTTFTLSTPCSYRNGVSSCTGKCSSNLTYINAGKSTVGIQSQYLRPAYAPGSGADYCAIPPSVSCPGNCVAGQYAAFVTGTATTATIVGGSGSVGIKFNTNADQEQVPLGKIRIDWGDSQDDFAYPFAPRNDPAKPHIFSHTYTLNRGDSANCATSSGRTTCEFKIKIQVVDSWGWSNDATVVDNGPDIQSHGVSGWFDTGLRVKVQP